jgi:hypothetical protein
VSKGGEMRGGRGWPARAGITAVMDAIRWVLAAVFGFTAVASLAGYNRRPAARGLLVNALICALAAALWLVLAVAHTV